MVREVASPNSLRASDDRHIALERVRWADVCVLTTVLHPKVPIRRRILDDLAVNALPDETFKPRTHFGFDEADEPFDIRVEVVHIAGCHLH